jgi:hypothetical protein
MKNDNSLCAYCGIESSEREHVIPLTYLGQKRGYDDKRQWIVDSCSDCNNLAGKSVFFSIPEKAKFIKERLEIKHKKIIQTPQWNAEELEEMGYTLREMIFGNIIAKKVLFDRIAHLEAVTSKDFDYLMPEFIKNRYDAYKREFIINHNKKMKEYIPIYKYCKKYGVSKQNVYRWIRENKLIMGEDYDREEVTTVRLRIREDLKPLNQK